MTNVLYIRRLYYGTSGGREFNTVDFTEANREDGGGRAVVAKPVGSINCLWTIDANHEVPVCQHLKLKKDCYLKVE